MLQFDSLSIRPRPNHQCHMHVLIHSYIPLDAQLYTETVVTVTGLSGTGFGAATTTSAPTGFGFGSGGTGECVSA